jgi:superfamily II DNA or RNA helicase
MDFDKDNWERDVRIVTSVCRENNIPYVVEKSRSGKGAHIWYFFKEKIKASLARKFAITILDIAMSKDVKINFESYDRLIPSQDFLIKGGFGNLIALPLQKKPRDNGNSVFVDENFNVIEDQWKCLAEISKIQKEEIDEFLEEQSNVKTLDVDIISGKPILVNKTDYSSDMKLILQNGIIISKKHMSTKGVVFLRRLGSYLNPEFYSKQAMRMSTYNIPRMTVLFEENESEIILPIGVLSDLKKVMNDIGVNFTIIDERTEGQLIDVSFDGVLRADQLEAFETLKGHDNGVLSATTGFGKTVLGAKLIAEKKVSTLVLVHTKELALQWLERLEQFLDIKYEVKVPLTPKGRKKKLMLVGQLGGGKKQLTGKIDVALMQSMFKRDKSVKEMIDDYGMIIVDECHHVGSLKYSAIMSRIKSKYIYGLTATPIRKDGHYRIIFMYCGPERFKIDAKKMALERSFEHYIVPRFTSCRKPLYQLDEEWHISDVMKHICDNSARNDMIVSDIDALIEEGKKPIILTERSSHIENLRNQMVDKPYEIIELSGRLKAKERKEALESIRKRNPNQKLVIIATGKLVGEGFDVPWLDTLILAMPIAWKGTIAQYAGRLHRESEGKNEVCVYDYVDVHINVLAKMYSKRLTAYKSLGYKVKPSATRSDFGDEIFSNDKYFESFCQDIKQSSKVIIIVSPFIQKNKIESIKETLYSKFHEGIRVVVCIKEIDEYKDSTKKMMHKIYSDLEKNGIDVIQIQGLTYKFAIFDDEIVWYGGIDLLAGNRTTDSVIRIVSGALANELYGAIE